MAALEYTLLYLSFGALCLMIMAAILAPVAYIFALIAMLVNRVFRYEFFKDKEGSKMGFLQAVILYPLFLIAGFFAFFIAVTIFDYFNIKIL